MKTTQIENYIKDVKENAKKTIATILAVATIGTGATTLASCDDLTNVKANEVTNGVTNEVTNEEITTAEETTVEETTVEETTEPIIENYEEELLNVLIKDYPVFENGVFLLGIIEMFKGEPYEYHELDIIAKNEKGEQDFNIIPPNHIEISKEQYESLVNKLINSNDLVELAPGQYGIYVDQASPETLNYMYSICYQIYMDQLENQTSPEQ